MPRSRGGGSAPRRPAAPAAPPRQAPQQTRSSSTAAHPPAQQQAPTQQSGGSGLFGQMASTAAGVAVGSSIGHAVGGWFSGGSSAAPAEQQGAYPAENTYNSTSANAQTQGPCGMDVQNFRNCMDQNQGSLTICGWYLDQLKACQQAASQY